jgi:hypothetical protein
MKNSLYFLLLSIGLHNFANASTFTCRADSNKKVIVSGRFSLQSASIKIKDDAGFIGIKNLDSQVDIEMPRSIRKKEASYSFIKYSIDLNAWQDLEFSLPKNISTKRFKAFLTLYVDDGNAMVPGDAEKLSCLLR